jgi:hypothetical protein
MPPTRLRKEGIVKVKPKDQRKHAKNFEAATQAKEKKKGKG